MSISLRAIDVYRSRFIQAVVGMLADSSPNNDSRTFVNSNPQATDVWTITVDTATNSHAYTIVVAGVTIVYTADASATVAEIADGLADAINDDPLSGGRCNAVSDGVSVVVITALLPNDLLAVTEGSATAAKLTTVHTTTADEADAIPFGRLIVHTGAGDEEGVPQVGLAAAALLSAQIDSWAITYENTIILNLEVTVDGVSYSVSHTMATDRDTSIDALVVKINADEMGLPANTVIATADAGTATAVVLTSEVAGKPFTSRMWLGVGGTVAAPALTRTAPIGSDVNRAARGISMYAADEEITTIEGEEASYPANSGVVAVVRGPVWVECSETVTYGLPVYVELGVTADNGKFFVATSATRVLLTGARWDKDSNSEGDDIAVLRVAF